jgi:cytochrome c-type biogenesis protein
MLATGLLYALGRMLAYTALGMALVGGLLTGSHVSSFLQAHVNQFLGPILILVSLVLLDLVSLGGSGPRLSEAVQRRVEALGIWGALALGVLFALSFCPISAVLFFLTLIPQAIAQRSPVALPSMYGLGTALPVVGFALILAFQAQRLGTAFNRLAQFEHWARRVTGIVFLLAGIYLSLVYIFDLSIHRTPTGWDLTLRLWS